MKGTHGVFVEITDRFWWIPSWLAYKGKLQNILSIGGNLAENGISSLLVGESLVSLAHHSFPKPTAAPCVGSRAACQAVGFTSVPVRCAAPEMGLEPSEKQGFLFSGQAFEPHLAYLPCLSGNNWGMGGKSAARLRILRQFYGLFYEYR